MEVWSGGVVNQTVFYPKFKSTVCNLVQSEGGTFQENGEDNKISQSFMIT